ncbi:MAG: LysE family translocator [Pseudomonadota bacterium]
MSLELYLTFVAATTALVLTPGPNVTLLVASSLSYGPRRALATLAGTSTAIAVQLAIVALGMTSVIALLADSFVWLRWLGVAYLLYLGVQQWRATPVALEDIDATAIRSRRLFWQGMLVSGTNPKILLFYAAFFPQFIEPSGSLGLQLGVLCTTFLAISVVIDSGFVLVAGRLRGWLRGRQKARLRNRVTGSLLIATGLGLALARRS